MPGNQTEPAFTAEVTAHGGIDLLDANPAWFQLMQRCSEPSASAAGDVAGKDGASQQFFQQLRENFQENDAYNLSSWIPIIVGGRSLLAQITPICDVESHIVRLMGNVRDITDKADSEGERLSNLCFFKNMDRINRTIQQASDLKQMMSDVLDLVLDIFNCDRTFLLHPCDPDAATWQVPMERTRPAYPGAQALGLEIEMTPEVADSFLHMLASDGPIQFGPETIRIIPPEVETQFQVKSFMSMVIYPKIGKPWQFGIHQCSSVRKWSASEERLLNEIGLRLSDGLTSMLILRDLKESEGKLKEAELQFHTLFDNLPDCIARFDRDGRVLLLNQTSLKTFNLSAEEAVGTLLTSNGPSSDPENAMLTTIIRRTFDEGIANRLETEWQTGEGRRSYSVLYIPEKDEHDRVVSVIGIAHDITDQKMAEEELRHSEERYRLIVDTASEGVWVVDSDNITTFVNSSMAEMLGYSVQEMLGRKMSDFLFAEDTESHQEIESILHHGETDVSERRLRRIDGKNLWTLASASPILSREQGYKGSITLFTDITQRRLQQEQLLYQAHYDALTGLPNRFLALDRLQQNINLAARKGETTALLFLDLDDFKKINDALGHEVGDQVLRMAATRLEQTIRSSDTVARLGGDEFVVLIQENADAEAIRPVAEKILETFQEIFLVMNRQVMLTASMGISIYPDHGDKPLLLLRNADTAMYHSKAMGGNTFHYFTESMNRHVAHRLQMEEQLRMALQRNELYIEFQPMVELSSDKIIGVEALLRWHNEILGRVSTTEFIEIAEQTGMIITIGEWVIDTALTYLKHWERWIDEDFRMALNVSPRQFRKVGFVDLLGRAMKRAGVTGNQIELEITEGMLLGDEVGAAQIITKLHELGVSISMDDFGTGYSSLSYLRDYHFDTLKIDRVFVRDIIEDPSDRELIIATLRMAKGLGVRVVAEGVESAEQLEFLRQEGCDFVQGWYFSKSVSPDDFAEMLQHKRHLP
ncbi:putative bifunctional diguanylate cyclase/phosphodiesterase [Candidatus Thiodiazotropha sp. CDECU1]|uniref:putative bifunctional diguanylate cyclase/phosphodiesterase n=1 Tax=Candidatus Thiodiazotropha sp. CDECU1 TaxID=3065865 RepID=UPI002930C0C8|nr:EAL domain-containing protein [Candidatus Thiodiazotropha sp. CDECU1]